MLRVCGYFARNIPVFSVFVYLSHINLAGLLCVCVNILLQRSRVGLSVNTLRKKCEGSDVASFGKKLIKQWKKLLPGTVLEGVMTCFEFNSK